MCVYIVLAPFPSIVTPRIFTCSVGDPYKTFIFHYSWEGGPTQCVHTYGANTQTQTFQEILTNQSIWEGQNNQTIGPLGFMCA